MFFQVLALISFLWLPEYSKPTFLVLFSRCSQSFPTTDSLHSSSGSSLMKLICVIFRKKWSSCWGTNSLRIIKQNLLLWKAQAVVHQDSQLHLLDVVLVSGFWVVSHHHLRSKGIWENTSWEVLTWKSSVERQGDQCLHNPNQTAWVTSRCLHHCSAKLASHAYPWAKGHEEHGGLGWLHRSLKLCLQGRWLQTQLNGLLSD